MTPVGQLTQPILSHLYFTLMYVCTYVCMSYMSAVVVCSLYPIDINKIFLAKLNCPFMKSLNLTTGFDLNPT